jgi:hypothetical protein
MSRLRRAEEKLRTDALNPYEFLQLKQIYEESAIGVGEEEEKRTGDVVDLPPCPSRICLLQYATGILGIITTGCLSKLAMY